MSFMFAITGFASFLCRWVRGGWRWNGLDFTATAICAVFFSPMMAAIFDMLCWLYTGQQMSSYKYDDTRFTGVVFSGLLGVLFLAVLTALDDDKKRHSKSSADQQKDDNL